MEEDQKAYSDEEFSLILKKAEELAEGPREPGASFSLEEMKAAAEEAGLDPALVERAARLTPSDPGGSPLRRLLSAIGWKRLRADFPTPLTQDKTIHLLSVIRASSGGKGEGEATPSGLYWSHGVGRVSVTMHNEGGGSRVQVSADPSKALVVGGWLGILGGWIMIGTLEPNTAIGFLSSVAVGLTVAIGAWAPIAIRAKRRVDGLMDTIGHTMQGMGPLPRISAEETGHKPGGETGNAGG